jgi:hypothetical protein
MIAQPIERSESKTSGTCCQGQRLTIFSWIASSGLISLICHLPMDKLKDRRVCRPGCDHVSATWLDQGWACGYKNFQMLLSSLACDPCYSTHLFSSDRSNHDVPSVSYLQKLIEKAWSAGFDSEGREQLNGYLVDSTKWIGPTEIMACLANLDIKCDCEQR